MRNYVMTSLSAAVLLAMSGAAQATYKPMGHPILEPSADAKVTNIQGADGNGSVNYRNDNTAKINGSFNGATGNLGANVAAGDSNAQSNSASLAALDADFVIGGGDESATARHGGGSKPAHPAPLTFASATAKVMSTQGASGNSTENVGNQNSAKVSDSFDGASGNVAVNVASGSGNVQANNMAAAVANVTSNQLQVLAKTDVSQNVLGNKASNTGLVETKTTEYAKVSLKLKADGTYEGTGSGVKGGYEDKSWGGGHGGKDKFKEEGDIELKGKVTGMIPVINTYASRDNFNTAVISNGSFNGASGNIGVNMASGSNNLQANNLSLSAGSGCDVCK